MFLSMNKVDHFVTANTIRHDFYIRGNMHEDMFGDLIHALHTATSIDVIYIHINSGGGDFYAACEIADAIRQSKAMYVVANVTGMCASAATLVMLACSSWLVSDFATFMFHTSSGGEYGDMPSTKKSILAHEEHLNRVAQLCYEGFFNEDEIDLIINHKKDVWLTPEEVRARLEVLTKAMKEADDKANEDIELAQLAIEEAGIDVAISPE